MFSHHQENRQTDRFRLVYSYLCTLHYIFMTGNFGRAFSCYVCWYSEIVFENTNSFTVIPSKPSKIYVSLSFSLVYISLVGSVTIANGHIGSTNFNRIQGGAWLKLSCTSNPKFHNVPYLGFVQFSVMF